MEKHSIEKTSCFVSSEERRQLVQLCARITGDRGVAEDLAQETLFEAWRHEQNLHNQDQRTQWLAGIARNVCLRWIRKRGRNAVHLMETHESQHAHDAPFAQLEDTLADDLDIEVELERKELVELLDRAMAYLPVETRTILIKHYVEESPLAEVAAQLGISAHAVTMRLHRGKLALRHVLTQEMRQEMAPYDLHSSTEAWEVTPLWCYYCGQHRLLGKRKLDEGELLLKCPACSPGAEEVLSKNRLPALKGVKGYKPLYSRLMAWCDHYYRAGLSDGSTACEECGRMSRVSITFPEDLPEWVQRNSDPPRCHWLNTERIVSILCASCTAASLISLESLVLSLSEGRQFLQVSPRIRALPKQQIEVDGSLAIVTRFESITDQVTLTVVSAYDTYEVLGIYRDGLCPV